MRDSITTSPSDPRIVRYQRAVADAAGAVRTDNPDSERPRRALRASGPLDCLVRPPFLSAQLNFEREDGIHDGYPPVHVDGLSGDEAGFAHAQQHDRVPDIAWRADTAHRRPATLVPGSDGLEHSVGSRLTTLSSVAPGLMTFTVMPRRPIATAK